LLNVVTGKKARVELVPKDVYIAIISKSMGDFVAIDLWEMMQAFAEIGFGEAGEPQYLNNTKEVLISTPASMGVDTCSSVFTSIPGLRF
jgi:hypothetical protein